MLGVWLFACAMVSETNFSCILLTESINQFIKYNLIMTCLHEFRIYESLNLFHEKFFFSFKVAGKCLFLEIDAFHDLEFYLVLKELGKKIVKKIVDSEFVKTFHEHKSEYSRIFRPFILLFFVLLSSNFKIKFVKI